MEAATTMENVIMRMNATFENLYVYKISKIVVLLPIISGLVQDGR